MKKRLLIITCHKLSDNNGGANASKGFIHAFARLFGDCALIFPEFDRPEDYIPSVYRLYPCHDSRPKWQKGLDMYRGVVNAICSFVCSHLKNHSYDIIVIDHSVTGTSLVKTLKRTGAKIITIHHNVERDYLRDNGNERPITFRYPYNFYAKRSERLCLELSDVNLTLTETDAATFRSWYPSRHLHVHCVGICEYRGIPEKEFSAKPLGNHFVITGSLCYIQSLIPILDFLREYYPVVKEECPGCQLTISGRNPSKELLDVCKNDPTITVIPNPEDIDQVVKTADYYICPINVGSGIKLRVIDGLKQGLAVLCHEVSANGYETLKFKNILYAYNDTCSFRVALQKLLSHPKKPSEIYGEYQNTLSVEAETQRLHNILVSENVI